MPAIMLDGLFNICSNLHRYIFVLSDFENCFTIDTYKIYSNGVNSPTVIKLSSTKSFFNASYQRQSRKRPLIAIPKFFQDRNLSTFFGGIL